MPFWTCQNHFNTSSFACWSVCWCFCKIWPKSMFKICSRDVTHSIHQGHAVSNVESEYLRWRFRRKQNSNELFWAIKTWSAHLKIIHLRCHFYYRFLHFDLFQAPGDLAHALPAVFRVFNAALSKGKNATPRCDTRMMLRFKVWSSQLTVDVVQFSRVFPKLSTCVCWKVYLAFVFSFKVFPSIFSKGKGLCGSWQPLGHLSSPLPVNNAIASVFPSGSRHSLCLPCAATWLASKSVKHPQVS